MPAAIAVETNTQPWGSIDFSFYDDSDDLTYRLSVLLYGDYVDKIV